MSETDYLIMRLETIDGTQIYRPLGPVRSYNAQRACEEYARTQPHEALLMEDGVTLVAVPLRSWTTVTVTASQQLKLETKVETHDDPPERP